MPGHLTGYWNDLSEPSPLSSLTWPSLTFLSSISAFSSHPLWTLCVCFIAQPCPSLCDPSDGSPPGCSVHGDSPGKNTQFILSVRSLIQAFNLQPQPSVHQACYSFLLQLLLHPHQIFLSSDPYSFSQAFRALLFHFLPV